MSSTHSIGDSPSVPSVEYRVIPGFPAYRCGSDGSLWTCYNPGASRAQPRTSTNWRRMKPAANSRGYLVVSLYLNGQRFDRRVCRLVLETFVGPCPPGMECCHEDNVHGNDRLSNLRWDTHKANVAETIRQGIARIGSKDGTAKLTEADIPEVMRLVAAGETYRAIGKRFGVAHSQISRIVRGKLWKHVPREIVIPRLRGRNQWTG